MSQGQVSNMVGSRVRVNRGGPDCLTGMLLGIHSDYLALATDSGTVYINSRHIKSLSSRNTEKHTSGGRQSAEHGSRGQRGEGQRRKGQRNAEHGSAGQRGEGQRSAGKRNAEHGSAGQRGEGQRSAGKRNAGQLNAGHGSVGQRNARQLSSGQRSAGKRNAGHGSYGQTGLRPSYIMAPHFLEVLHSLRHQYVSINNGPDKEEGLLTDVNHDHLLLQSDDELSRIPVFHIKSIRAINKSNKSGSRSGGSRSAGSKSAGSRSAGQRSSGHRSVGHRSVGNRGAGSRSAKMRGIGSRIRRLRRPGSSSRKNKLLFPKREIGP